MELIYNWRPFSELFPMVKSDLFGTKHTKFYLLAEQTVNGDNLDLRLRLCLEECQRSKLHVTVKWRDTLESRISNYGDDANTSKEELSLDKEQFAKWHRQSWTSNLKDYMVSIQVNFTEILPVKNVIQAASTSVEPAKASFPMLNHEKELASTFAALRLNANNTSDITLVTTVDGKAFPAHKLILSARSPVFKAMFENEKFMENQVQRVEIDDISGEVMEALLKYIYQGNIEKIQNIAGDLLAAADKYDIPLLGKECLQTMMGTISVQNAAKYFYLADLHNLNQLKGPVAEFIDRNKRAVRNSAGWRQFIRPNGALLGQLFDLL